MHCQLNELSSSSNQGLFWIFFEPLTSLSSNTNQTNIRRAKLELAELEPTSIWLGSFTALISKSKLKSKGQGHKFKFIREKGNCIKKEAGVQSEAAATACFSRKKKKERNGKEKESIIE